MTPNPYALENIVTAALVQALTEAATGLPVFARFSEEMDMPAERIEVQARAFKQESDQMLFKEGTPYFCHFSGVIEIEIHTRRIQNTDTKHDVAISRIRQLMTREAQTLGAAVLPDHEVLRLNLTATTTTQDSDDARDMTEMTYDVELAVLPSAFPTT